MSLGVIVAGQYVECDVPIVSWRERPQLAFKGLRHRPETRAVILHHTAGEGDASQVHRTLTQRRLSVHFHVGHTGAVTQYADCEARASHAGHANGWSIGIEIQNRGNTSPVQSGIKRALVVERIHGVDVTHTTILPAQVTSVLALLETLCTAYELPFKVPMFGTDVLATVLAPTFLEQWRGVLGHMHVAREKVDPGLAVLRAVAAQHLRGVDGNAE